MAQKLSNKNNASYWESLGGVEVSADKQQDNNTDLWNHTKDNNTDLWSNIEGGVEVPADASQDSWLGSAKAVLEGGVNLVDSLTTLPLNLAIKANNANLDLKSKMDPRVLSVMDPEAVYVPPEHVESAKLSEVPTLHDVTDPLVGYTPENETTPLQEGLKFTSSVVSPAALGKSAAVWGGGKVASALSKPLMAIGSTKPLVVAGAGAGGATSQYLKQEGFGGGSQLAGGLAADLGVQALRGLNPVKLASSALGLGKKHLKTDMADAFERIGVDPMAAALSDSKFVTNSTRQISQIPLAGEYLRYRQRETSKQFQDSFGKLADEVGPRKTPEVEKIYQTYYDRADKLLPENATVAPKNTFEKVKKYLKESITLLPEDKEKEVFEALKNLNSYLVSGNIPIPVYILKNTKRSLNKQIPWDSDKTGPLALVQRALNEDIAQYGKTNKAWYDEFQKAETTFAATSKRESLEKLIKGTIEDRVTKEVKYIPFVDQLSDPKYSKRIRNILGEDKVHRLKDFIKSAEGMAQVNKNIRDSPKSFYDFFKYFIKTVSGTLLGEKSPTAAAAGAGLIGITAYLLTSKRFLNKATDFAKKPSVPLAKQLETIIKDNTGYTIQEINRLSRDEDQKKE